jgi:hypothetical protein
MGGWWWGKEGRREGEQEVVEAHQVTDHQPIRHLLGKPTKIVCASHRPCLL